MDDRLFRMSIFVLSFCVLSLPVRRSAVFNIYHTFEYVIPVFRGGRRTCIERLARPRKDRNPGFKAAGRHINPSGFRSFVLLVPRRPKTGMTVGVGIGTVLNRKAGCALPFQVFLALPNVQVMENLQAFPHIPLHPAY